MEDIKTLVMRFENALVAFHQYDAFLEHSDSYISKSQEARLNALDQTVNSARSALLAYGEE